MTDDPYQRFVRRENHAVAGCFIAFLFAVFLLTTLVDHFHIRDVIRYDQAMLVKQGPLIEEQRDSDLTPAGWLCLVLSLFAARAFFLWYMESPFISRLYDRPKNPR